MLTQGGTNASNSMKLTSIINQNKTNFPYDTEKKNLTSGFHDYFQSLWAVSIFTFKCTLTFTIYVWWNGSLIKMKKSHEMLEMTQNI